MWEKPRKKCCSTIDLWSTGGCKQRNEFNNVNVDFCKFSNLSAKTDHWSFLFLISNILSNRKRKKKWIMLSVLTCVMYRKTNVTKKKLDLHVPAVPIQTSKCWFYCSLVKQTNQKKIYTGSNQLKACNWHCYHRKSPQQTIIFETNARYPPVVRIFKKTSLY